MITIKVENEDSSVEINEKPLIIEAASDKDMNHV